MLCLFSVGGIVWECVVSRRKRYLLCVLSTFNTPQSAVSFFLGSTAYVALVQSKYWTCTLVPLTVSKINLHLM